MGKLESFLPFSNNQNIRELSKKHQDCLDFVHLDKMIDTTYCHQL